MTRFKKNFAASLLAIAALAPSHTLHAQGAYPQKTITMVVPAAAGGPSDTVARLVADAMGTDLGQRIVIENIGGAGGSIGAGRVAKAAPDGYTVLLYHIGVATFSALYPKLNYKPGDDLEAVGLVTEVPLVIVGRKAIPANNVAELFTWLRGQREGATFGTAGVGAVSDLCGRLLKDAGGIALTVVPYKGTGPAMNDLVSGQLDLMCDQTTNTTSQIEANQVKAFAVTTRQRINTLPNVPALAEGSLNGFDLSAWHAIWAPKGTPEAVRTRLSAALQKALTDSKVIERFAALGTSPVSADLATPAAHSTRFKTELERWGKLLRGAEEK